MSPRYPIASRQPYTGQPVDNSPILTNAQLPYVGQLGPAAAATIASTHGRQLAGLGALQASKAGVGVPVGQLNQSALKSMPAWSKLYYTDASPTQRARYIYDIWLGRGPGSSVTGAYPYQHAPFMAFLRSRVGFGYRVCAATTANRMRIAVVPAESVGVIYASNLVGANGQAVPWKDVTASVLVVPSQPAQPPMSGLGDSVVPSDDDPAHFNDEPDWHDGAMRSMEDEDDVVGSGLFDSPGRTTVHDDMGVFRDHPSVPGYIARNPPYTLNQEVRDIVNGGPTVEVSGGGLFYIERDGKLADLPTTRVTGGYVEITPQGTGPVGWSRPSTVYPSMPLLPQQSTTRLIEPSSALVEPVSTVNVANVSRPVSGFGADEQEPEKAGWGSWLVAGLIVGTAGAIAWGTLKKV